MFNYFISFVYHITIGIISIHVLSWIWKELSMGICRCKGSLNGKVVLITGGNNGIGFETTVELARRGARLIIGCRNTKNVESRIQNLVPDAEVELIQLDLSSCKSIQKFAEEIKVKYDKIDVLINNAGMGNQRGTQKESKDGFELTMATNYLGHALLNHLLLDLVKRAGQGGDGCSRIILVSSIASADKKAALDLCQLGPDAKSYNINFGVKEMGHPVQYGKSKLAQIMYGKHLAKVFEEQDCNTLVASLHPGFVRTDIFQIIPPGPKKALIDWASYVVGKTPFQGAQTTIHLALCNFSLPFLNKNNGNFYSDCRLYNWYDFIIPKLINDPVACKSVWDETMKVLTIADK